MLGDGNEMVEATASSHGNTFEDNLHNFIGIVVNSVLGEFYVGFDEREEDNMQNDVSESSLHYAIKCADVSKSTDKLYEGIRGSRASLDSGLDEVGEALVTNIKLEGEESHSNVTFENLDLNMDADKASSVRAKSDHQDIQKTSSIRNVIHRIFNRSKSAHDSPSKYEELVERDQKEKVKKPRRFFKKSQPKPKGASIEIQHGGADVTPETQNKLIAEIYSRNNPTVPESQNENNGNGKKSSRISLSGIRNSLVNLFRGRPVVV